MERVAIFDLDGTLMDGRVWQVFVRHHLRYRVHLRALAGYLTRNFGQFFLYKMRLRTRADVWDRFAREIVTLVRGMDEAQAQRVFETIYDEFIAPQLDPALLERWRVFGEEGYQRFIVSGSPAPILELIGTRLGATATFGTLVEVRDGRYTGGIVGELCQDAEKARRVQEWIAAHRVEVDWAASYSFADSYSDRPILELAGHPIAVRPEPPLFEYAKQAGWMIVGEPVAQ